MEKQDGYKIAHRWAVVQMLLEAGAVSLLMGALLWLFIFAAQELGMAKSMGAAGLIALAGVFAWLSDKAAARRRQALKDAIVKDEELWESWRKGE